MSTSGHSARLPSLRQNGRHHLLQKLHFRELYGETRQTRSRPRQRLFYQLPHRLAFSLAQVAPASALAAGHIFLGFTKCGQFVLSYTHSCDTDDHTLQMIHRYRLHWWLFVPYAPMRKVAEVMLFGEQDLQESVYENIFISVCQWPKDLSKILVYGCSMVDGNDGNSSQTRRCYITITAVPSLDNCSACFQVATSYEEEDLAERWNSCVRFSCLQHGITVHTSFEMVAPFPRFLPNVQMKREGYVVLNAGNFIHVLNVDLENKDRKMKEVEMEILGVRLDRINEEDRDEEESDDEREQIRVKSDRTIECKPYAVPNVRSGKEFNVLDGSSSEGDPEAEVQSSSDTENSQQEKEQNLSSPSTSNLKVTVNTGGMSSGSSSMTDRDREWEILIGSVAPRCDERTRHDTCKDKYGMRGNHERDSNTDIPGVSHCYDIDVCDNRGSDNASGQEDGATSVQGFVRKLQLKEFHLPDDSPYHLYGESDTFNDNDSDDSTRCSHLSEDSRLGRYDLRDAINLGDRCKAASSYCGSSIKSDEYVINCQFTQQRRVLRSSGDSSYMTKTLTKQAEKEYEFIDEITDSRHEKLSVFRRRRLADKKYEFSDENMENVPQKYSSFRNQRRIIMSPSRSPRFRSVGVPLSELSIELGESSGLLRSVYEKLLSPSSGSTSPSDVLRPINQNITSPILSPRDDRWREEMDRLEKVELQRWSSRESLGLYSLSPGYVQKAPEKSPNIVANSISEISQVQALKCVADFSRRYIEVDDELVSIITDIEDDELGTATGYHNALPLEVHGSGYTQMHMISNSKAEKLMAPGVLVRQVSLDVEQFCHEMAQKLCTEAGKKYFFCTDYSVEIVDVCPSSGNIIAMASVLVQAATVMKGLSKAVRSPLSSLTRRQYRTTATFVFNMDTKNYYIVDKEPLTEDDPYSLESTEGDSSDERWWQSARQAARQMRTQWAVPTDYYSSVKVLTNEPLLKGKSLNHIMEGQHLVALVLGPQQHIGS